jgi:hypothetical protein
MLAVIGGIADLAERQERDRHSQADQQRRSGDPGQKRAGGFHEPGSHGQA